MGFNLNRNGKNEYQLAENHIVEVINMYGVQVDFLLTERMNIDPVLKDFSHLKMKEGNSKKLYMLPEDSAGFEGSMDWNLWGLNNKRSITFFVSRKSLEDILLEVKEEVERDIQNGINPPITGREHLANVYTLFLNGLLVLPSGTILEITDVSQQTEGMNNLFTYADDNSVYTFTTTVYYNSQQNEMEYDKDKKDDLSTKPQNLPQDPSQAPKIDYQETGPTDAYEESFEDLDKYFDALEDTKVDQDVEGQTISSTDSVFGSLG